MARDPESLKIEKWAESGDRTNPEDRSSPALVRVDGYPASFSQVLGDTPAREVWNQILREVSGMLLELNQRGALLEWDDEISYLHPAHVIGSDNRIYQSQRNNLDKNPTTSSADWLPIISSTSGRIAPTTYTFTPSKTNLYSSVKAILHPSNQANVSADDTNNEIDFAIPTIHISDDAPTSADGANGDVWLEY